MGDKYRSEVLATNTLNKYTRVFGGLLLLPRAKLSFTRRMERLTRTFIIHVNIYVIMGVLVMAADTSTILIKTNLLFFQLRFGLTTAHVKSMLFWVVVWSWRKTSPKYFNKKLVIL